MVKSRSQITIILLFLILSFFQTPGYASSPEDTIDSLLNRYHHYRLFNGVALVVRNGELIYEKGFGYADFDHKILNTPDTRFRIASLTKAFTALLIMQLVEEDKIALDDCISDYLDYFPESRGDLITIHQLLCHTSGLPDYTTFPGFLRNNSDRYYSTEELIKVFADSTLEFVPGTVSRYSNSGYIVLGAIIEKVTGKSYADVLKERIFKPLEMNNSGYNDLDADIENQALGYYRGPFKMNPSNPQHISTLFSAAGVYSTARDLFKWDRSFYTYRILSKEYKKLLFNPNWNNYAYGWRIRKVQIGAIPDTILINVHNGRIFGFTSRIVRIPADYNTIILLENLSPGLLTQISDKLIAILYDQPFEYPKRSGAEVIAQSMLNDGIEQGLQLYTELYSSSADTVFFSEFDFNAMGYQLMRINALDEAIAIFKLNVQTYPKSANTYDSLGEAYMLKGDYIRAKKNYEKVFEKLPGDLNINPDFKNGLINNAQQKLSELKRLMDKRKDSFPSSRVE